MASTDSMLFDAPDPTKVLALKIKRDEERDYWIAYRRSFGSNLQTQNGACVLWGYNAPRQSDLLVLSPRPDSAQNAALPIGHIFADPTANISLRPLSQGGVPPLEYLEIEIAMP